MTKVRRLLAVLFVLALGAGLAACGSDSDSGSGSGDSAAASELEGVTWELMNIASQGSASGIPNTVDPPTLEIEDGRVNVFGGCNSGSGDAEIADTTIDFGPIALTKKACEGLGSQIESYVTVVLAGEVPYEIVQGNLNLEGKQFTLIFKKG